MTDTIKQIIMVLEAQYIEDAKSILILGECDKGKVRTPIHRDSLGTYGNRSESEISSILQDIAKSLIGKNITLEYDPSEDI